jgi:hypothetical protein
MLAWAADWYYAEGYQDGQDATETRLLTGLAEALAGRPGVPLSEAVGTHLRITDQGRRRREWRARVARERAA